MNKKLLTAAPPHTGWVLGEFHKITKRRKDIWYKIKLIYSVLIKKISSLLSVDYYKSNNENQFKDIQLQLHATKVTNPYTFSIQGNKSFSGICKSKSSYVIAYGSKPWYSSDWPDASKVSDLTTINGGVKFSVKNAIDLRGMFYECYQLTSLNLSNFDTSNVTNMYGMFASCSGLTSLDLSNFDTSKVTNMGAMFDSCSGLTSLDLSNFNTSNVTNMYAMFTFCSGLTSLNLSNFDTSKVTNMRDMFYRCSALKTLDYSLTGFKANGIAPDLSRCTNLKTLRLHHATSANVQDFITKAKVPSSCKVSIV